MYQPQHSQKKKKKMYHQPQQNPFCCLDYYRSVTSMLEFKSPDPSPFGSVDAGVGEAHGSTFYEFLEEWGNNNYQNDLWWKFDEEKVICFGSEGRKLFLGIAEIVISFHKEKKFSGNLFRRIRVLSDLNVTHESAPIENENDFEDGGQRNDIFHFRWMVAAVVKKAFPNEYSNKLSSSFLLFFSQIFTVREGVKNYFVSQLYHPIFFNSSDRCSLIRIIRHLYKLNQSVFKSNFILRGFSCWWIRINNRKTVDTLHDVLHYGNSYITLYSNHPNGCTLPLYIRNVHEHLKKGDNDHKKIDLELDDLFAGVSAVLVDSAIRNLHEYWSLFGSGATLSDLQLTPPNGSVTSLLIILMGFAIFFTKV